MSLKLRIRQWLGITDPVFNQQMIFNELVQLHTKIDQTHKLVGAVANEVAIHNRALGRVIAKLDPIFADDEMSPARKAESDRNIDAVIRKLIGEHLASRAPGDTP